MKACGAGALLSHFAAAALYGLVRWDWREIDVTVGGVSRRVHAGVRVTGRACSSRPTRLPTRASRSPRPPGRCSISPRCSTTGSSGAQSSGTSLQLVSMRELVEIMDRLGSRRGTRKLARIVASGPAPTRSELEDVVLDLIAGGGLARPHVNVPLIVAGRRVIPDFRWPAAPARRRGRRRSVARRQARARGRRRAPGAALGERGAGVASDVGAGGPPPRRDPRSLARRGSAGGSCGDFSAQDLPSRRSA